MKNRLLNKSMVGLIIVLSVVKLSLADDSFSVAVSCSIPAIPGVNAPPFETGRLETQVNTVTSETAEPQKENGGERALLIEEDTQKEQITGKNQKTTIIVKTLYSR